MCSFCDVQLHDDWWHQVPPDLEEPCYESRHLSMILLLGLPQLFLLCAGSAPARAQVSKAQSSRFVQEPSSADPLGAFLQRVQGGSLLLGACHHPSKSVLWSRSLYLVESWACRGNLRLHFCCFWCASFWRSSGSLSEK